MMKRVVFILIFLSLFVKSLFAIGDYNCNNLEVTFPEKIVVHKGEKSKFKVTIKNNSSKTCSVNIYECSEPSLIVYLGNYRKIAPNETKEIEIFVGYSYEEGKKSFNKSVDFFVNFEDNEIRKSVSVDFIIDGKSVSKDINAIKINKPKDTTDDTVSAIIGIVLLGFFATIGVYLLIKLYKIINNFIYKTLLKVSKSSKDEFVIELSNTSYYFLFLYKKSLQESKKRFLEISNIHNFISKMLFTKDFIDESLELVFNQDSKEYKAKLIAKELNAKVTKIKDDLFEIIIFDEKYEVKSFNILFSNSENKEELLKELKPIYANLKEKINIIIIKDSYIAKNIYKHLLNSPIKFEDSE